MEGIRWVTFKEIKTSQGVFKMTWSNNQFWTPSEYVALDDDGTIKWIILQPAGILMKYPDGTKRFLKSEV